MPRRFVYLLPSLQGKATGRRALLGNGAGGGSPFVSRIVIASLRRHHRRRPADVLVLQDQLDSQCAGCRDEGLGRHLGVPEEDGRKTIRRVAAASGTSNCNPHRTSHRGPCAKSAHGPRFLASTILSLCRRRSAKGSNAILLLGMFYNPAFASNKNNGLHGLYG